MGVSLIVTKSYDRDCNETGDSIADVDWIAFVESDDSLSLRSKPFTATLPDGSFISMSAPPGQSEFTLPDGTRIPFLALSSGRLSMRFHPDMEEPSNPVRLKVAELWSLGGYETLVSCLEYLSLWAIRFVPKT